MRIDDQHILTVFAGLLAPFLASAAFKAGAALPIPLGQSMGMMAASALPWVLLYCWFSDGFGGGQGSLRKTAVVAMLHLWGLFLVANLGGYVVYGPHSADMPIWYLVSMWLIVAICSGVPLALGINHLVLCDRWVDTYYQEKRMDQAESEQVDHGPFF